MSQFGLQPFGTASLGGPGKISLLGVLPVAANEVIAVFDAIPRADDEEAYTSAVNTSNWALEAIDPTIASDTVIGQTYVPKGKIVPTRTPLVASAFVDDDDPTQIHLTLDSRLEDLVDYELEVLPSVRGDQCEVLFGPTVLAFVGLKPGPARRARFIQEDRYRDWDNTFFPSDIKQPEATWRIAGSTDIALHGAVASLRKRILRRILSNRGAFKHLPAYGADPRIKALIRSGQVQTLPNAVGDQVGREPDVLQAACTASLARETGEGAVISLEIFVDAVWLRSQRFVFDFPAG